MSSNLSAFVDQCLCPLFKKQCVVFIFPGKAMHHIDKYFSLLRVY